MNFRTRTLLLVGYRSIGASSNRRARNDDRSFPGINMQRVTRGVSSDSSMVGCTCTCTRTRVFRWRAAREREWAHERAFAQSRWARVYCIYACAYVKILYNGILHNGLCPSRSWKEMKNEAFLSAAPRRFLFAGVHARLRAYVRARVCPSNVLSYTHLFLFSPVRPFPYLSVFRCTVTRRLKRADCGKILIYCHRRSYFLHYSPPIRHLI